MILLFLHSALDVWNSCDDITDKLLVIEDDAKDVLFCLVSMGLLYESDTKVIAASVVVASASCCMGITS